jgi:hypothetical protein
MEYEKYQFPILVLQQNIEKRSLVNGIVKIKNFSGLLKKNPRRGHRTLSIVWITFSFFNVLTKSLKFVK